MSGDPHVAEAAVRGAVQSEPSHRQTHLLRHLDAHARGTGTTARPIRAALCRLRPDFFFLPYGFCLTCPKPPDPTQILSEWFGRSVIRSCVKLSYDHAQSMIEAPDKMFSAEELPPVDPEHPIDEIHQAVLNLHAIAKSLRSQRFSGGALRLDQVRSHSKVFLFVCFVLNSHVVQ